MNKLIRKIRSKKGETLIEALASILVFTMSSILLLSMIATAAKATRTAKTEEEKLAAELYVAEAQDASVPGTVVEQVSPITFSFENNIISPYTTFVTSYSSGGNTLYSYTSYTLP